MLTNQKGISIVEILITIGLAAILFPALLTGFVASRGGRAQQDERIQATAFLQETQEAVRSVREKDWTDFAAKSNPPPPPPGQIYHPSLSGSSWNLVAGSETVNGLTRQVIIEDVYRDATGLIVSSGSPGSQLDPSTKKTVSTVSWGEPLPSSITSTEYLTRYFGNVAQIQTQTVQPAAGFGDWCNPSLLAQTKVDLIRQGFPTSVWAFQTTAGNYSIFTGTGKSADGPAFSNIDITGNPPPTNPPVNDWNEHGTKANGVFGDEHFAYLATESRGLVILDLSSFPYQQAGSFNPPGQGGVKPASSVYVVGNRAYMATTNKFYILDVSNKSSIQQIGVLSLADGAKVFVDNNNQYAYVANPDSNQELKIIDVHSNPASPTVVGWANVSGGAGKDIYVSGDKAYLLTANSGAPEFFIIDLSPTRIGSQTIVDSYDSTTDTSGMNPTGIAVVSPTRAIIVGTGGSIQYDVIDMTLSPIAKCNPPGLAINGGVNGISSLLQADGHAYSYIVTNDSSAELQIIEGGSGAGGGGGGNGTFESATFDAGHDVAFNYFSATTDPNLTYKISIKHGSVGNCGTVTFSDSDFTTFPPGALPLTSMGSGYVNPGQCLKYRAINSGSSAITFTISFNYSP